MSDVVVLHTPRAKEAEAGSGRGRQAIERLRETRLAIAAIESASRTLGAELERLIAVAAAGEAKLTAAQIDDLEHQQNELVQMLTGLFSR